MGALFAAEPLIGTPDCPLGNLVEAATWPDCIRREGWRWGYTSAWHYQTEPVTEEYDARKNCSGGNCVSAQIARNLMEGAAVVTRAQQLRTFGVAMPPASCGYRPRPLG